MTARVWIVIVNFRTPALVKDCLRSLSGQSDVTQDAHVIIVDNDSGDGSADTLSAAIRNEGWSVWAEVVVAGRNGGFAFGNNAGIRKALQCTPPPEYLMLLNPDTVAHCGAVRRLTEFMDANPAVGIAGSRLENAEGGAECSAHNAPSPLGELLLGASFGVLSRVFHRYEVTPPLRDGSHDCDWVSGASMMIRREVLEQIGLLDEEYFLYFEEVDFCTRARHAGWQIWFVPESAVVHLEGASTGIQVAARRRPRYWFDSRRRYFVKHHGVGGLILADVLWAAGRLLLAVRRLLRLGSGGNGTDPSRFALDLLWGDLRALVSRKRNAP